jgi:hypothetical protein
MIELTKEEKKRDKIYPGIFTKEDERKFFAQYKSTIDNPAFIDEFIDICWVDPFSENPNKP